MARWVVNAVSENPAYAFYLPIVNFLWRRLGWEPLSILVGSNWDPKWLADVQATAAKVHQTAPLAGYGPVTTAQVSRLFAAALLPECYLLTSDVDMLVLSNDLFDRCSAAQPIQVYGADLYGPSRFPMCYIGMWTGTWRSLFQITSLEASLERIRPRPNDWNLDENYLTEHLRPQLGRMQLIPRGIVGNGRAARRMDRIYWDWNGQKDLIDMHANRPGKAHWPQTRQVLAAYLTPNELARCDEFAK